MTDATESQSIPFAGLWKRKGKDGREFLMGTMPSGAKLILVRNDHREDNPKAPHYWLRLVAPEPKDTKKIHKPTSDGAAWKGGPSPEPEFNPANHAGRATREDPRYTMPEDEIPF